MLWFDLASKKWTRFEPGRKIRKWKQKKYDDQYRCSAVELAEFSGKQLKEVAQDMGIDVTTLRRWRRQFIGKIEPLKTQGLSIEQLEKENQRLRQENEYLTRQREILKKAMSILGQAEGNGGMR